MAVREILKMGDARLLRVAQPVRAISRAVTAESLAIWRFGSVSTPGDGGTGTDTRTVSFRTESGRTWVVYIVCAPPTSGPTGCHTPSLATGVTPSGT